jgi:ubiquinone/menaquinone biosynthesis C-methylase UbiE
MGQDAEAASFNDFDSIADVYDELVDWAPYERWVRRLEKRLLRRGMRRDDPMLDAACGTGLSLLPWLRRGYDVVGTDASRTMLERAEARVERNGYQAELKLQDLTALDIGRTVRVALVMHSGLDYILDDDRLALAFRSLRGCLQKGGLLAFDKCLDVPDFYREDYSDFRRLSCGTAQFDYRWDRSRRLLEQRCIVTRTDGRAHARTEVLYHLKATPPELLNRMLADAGFELLEPVTNFHMSDPGMGIYGAA